MRRVLAGDYRETYANYTELVTGPLDATIEFYQIGGNPVDLGKAEMKAKISVTMPKHALRSLFAQLAQLHQSLEAGPGASAKEPEPVTLRKKVKTSSSS